MTPQETDPDFPRSVQESLGEAWVGGGLLQGPEHFVVRTWDLLKEVVIIFIKKDFIDFLLEAQALKFGEFVTKSGRNTPFFINLGCFNDGEQLQKLGGFYAEAIKENFGDQMDILFGPAYKGIPIATATAIALWDKFGIKTKYCSNRKEIKDHGDTGIFLGNKLASGDKIVIVEDVTTAGTSVYETMDMVKDLGVQVLGLVVSVDRMERGKTEKSAIMQSFLGAIKHAKSCMSKYLYACGI